MSPLQLSNAITWYKSTLRECKTVGQRKETNILRNVISLFLLPDCVSCSPVIRCCPMWPPQGIFWPIGLLKELEGHMRRTLRLYVTANDWWYNKEFDWVERQTLAENLKIRGKHSYLFPEGPVFKLLILSYSWKWWGWKFIKPRCNGGRRSTFVGSRALFRDFSGKQFHCQMSCDLEVTNKSARWWEKISSCITIGFMQLVPGVIMINFFCR